MAQYRATKINTEEVEVQEENTEIENVEQEATETAEGNN